MQIVSAENRALPRIVVLAAVAAVAITIAAVSAGSALGASDRTPPTVTVSQPTEGATVPTGSVTVVFSATDASGIRSVTCKLSTERRASACVSPKSYSITKPGSYSVTITAVDKYFNSKKVVRSFKVAVPDTTPPTVSITAPLNGQVFTTNSVTAQFAANDPGSPSSGIASTSCLLTGPSSAIVFDGACQSPAVFNNLANGSYVLAASATDVAGNTSSATVNFTINVSTVGDTVAPVINISSPLAGEAVITSDATLTATFDVTDVAQSGVPPSGVKTVTCWMNGAVSFGESACASPKTFSGVIPGEYVFVVRATDNAGNTTYLDRRFTVQICSGCVDLRITYPSQDNQVITVSNNPAFQFVAKESSGLAMSTDCAVTPAGQAPTSFTPCTSPWPAGSRANGNYTLTVQATDSGGTVRTVARNFSIQVSSDTTSPVVSIFGVSAVAGTAQISWSASDNVGVVDRICTMSAPGLVFIDRFGCTSPTVYGGLPSGLSYTFIVRAYDAAGNHGSASISFFMP